MPNSYIKLIHEFAYVRDDESKTREKGRTRVRFLTIGNTFYTLAHDHIFTLKRETRDR